MSAAHFAIPEASAVIPAELSFLTIYNPSLGDQDETLHDQIVFYSSKGSRASRWRRDANSENAIDHEEENERLRHVGLAQGMVSFARNFSDGQPIDSIETEKSRIVLHELETGWWILASVDLTRLPHAHASNASDDGHEYSSREVAPPQLLIQQLKRAHSIFLLHQAASLDDLYVRLSRPKFCGLLERFWSRFIWNWNVLLHGNPAVDIFNGTKLSAGGELGIGVGEEEWGSGEREVLEDFVARTEGLVDLVVSRFGDAPPEQTQKRPDAEDHYKIDQDMWLGTGTDPRPSDGVLFSGVGALSKHSLATVSHWMEWIFKYGSDAYGIGESPSSTHRRRKRRVAKQRASSRDSMRRLAMKNRTLSPGIPPPIVRAVDQSLESATTKVQDDHGTSDNHEYNSPNEPKEASSALGTDVMMKYLTLGYGYSWKFPGKALTMRRKSSMEGAQSQNQTHSTSPEASDKHDDTDSKEQDDEPLKEVEPTPEVSDDDMEFRQRRFEESIGKFLVGLTGDLENEPETDDNEAGGIKDEGSSEPQRIVIRTLTVEASNQPSALNPTQESEFDPSSQPPSRYHKVQVLIYVHQPFIFTFLFSLHTSSLNYPSFYRSIHHQLGPLQKPLLSSSDPINVAQRIEAAMGESHHTTYASHSRNSSPKPSPFHSIHDLIYDPRKHTVHTSISNIPAPGTLAAEGLQPFSHSTASWLTFGIPTGTGSSSSTSKKPSTSPSGTVTTQWTRITALNVHVQILNMYHATRSLPNEVERTAKTSRGWWTLWMRVPHQKHVSEQQQGQTHPNRSEGGEDTAEDDPLPPREAFLIRQATDATGTNSGSSAGSGRKISTAGGRGFGLLARERDIGGLGGGPGAGGSGSATTGVAEGIGVDARRWVEGLLALSR